MAKQMALPSAAKKADEAGGKATVNASGFKGFYFSPIGAKIIGVEILVVFPAVLSIVLTLFYLVREFIPPKYFIIVPIKAFVVFCVVGIVGIIINYWFLLRYVVDEIQHLRNGMLQIADGNLTHAVSSNRNDEIGVMMNTLEKMRSALNSIIKKVSDSAMKVAASSQETAAASDQSGKAISDIASTIQEVAIGGEKQAKSTVEIDTAVDEIDSGMNLMSENVEKVSSYSDLALSIAREGGSTIEKTVKKMDQISSTVDESSKVVHELGEQSKEIGQIVGVITGIADQTNLLALNAAIEAARAGEQGRGFSVVAEEVRKLAEESAKAADRIGLLIKDVQSKTTKAVEAMAIGTREVAEGVGNVQEAGEAFANIRSEVYKTNEQMSQIKEASQQMALLVKDLAKSIDLVSKVASENASRAETVTANTQETTASAQEIAASAHSLSVLAEELQSVISRFKV